MEQIQIKTLQEAKRVLDPFSLIQVMLALNQGDSVTIVDEHNNREYVFASITEEENTNGTC